jgi:hypothetical protein
MRSKRILAFAVSFVLAAAVFAQAPGEKPVFMLSADLKWGDLDPGFPGIKIVDVWGDHARGGYGAFLRFPPGFLGMAGC